MAERRYHHGDLRSALLTQAEKTLQSAGVDALSLRELAREVGVSHGAPRRHFDDKLALLDALAAEGFRRLGVTLTEAAEPDDRDFVATLRDVAVTYVRFATTNPALVDLMSANRYLADASSELRRAREAAFSAVEQLVSFGQSTGQLGNDGLAPVGTILFATLHGIAVLANNKMIDPLEEKFVRDAVNTLLNGLAPRE